MNMIQLALFDKIEVYMKNHVTLSNSLFSAKIRSFGRVTSIDDKSAACSEINGGVSFLPVVTLNFKNSGAIIDHLRQQETDITCRSMEINGVLDTDFGFLVSIRCQSQLASSLMESLTYFAIVKSVILPASRRKPSKKQSEDKKFMHPWVTESRI
jgi:hypothetical protein